MTTNNIKRSAASKRASTGAQRRGPDVFKAIVLLAERLSAEPTFYRESFRSVARHFRSPYAALCVQLKAKAVEDSWHCQTINPDFWKDTVQEFLTECITDHSPMARYFNAKNAELRIALIACPLTIASGEVIGAVAMAVSCDDVPRVHAVLAELKAMTSLMTACAGRLGMGGKPGSKTHVTDQASALARAASYASKYDLAFTITNKLRNKIGCDQVALGVVKGRRVQLLSISGFDDIAPRSPGATRIRAAMEECLDRNRPIVSQPDDTWSDDRLSTGHRLHEQWSLSVGGASVATIPLQIKGSCICTLSLRRSASKPFTREELDNIRGVVEPWAPGITLIDRADRNLVSYVCDLIHSGIHAVLQPKEWTRKTILLLTVALTGWFCFGSLQHRLTVSCVVVPLNVQHVVAPYNGTIKAAYVTAGDRVSMGQPLYELDATDVELEHDRLLASVAVSKIQMDQAIASKLAAEAQIASAQLRVYESQLQSAQRRIRQAVGRTLYDGTVTVGDLRTHIGQSIAQGDKVFEIARNDGWLIELEIPNDMATYVSSGLTGQFASHTRPDNMRDCEIVRVRPTGEQRDGQTVFIAEAELDEPAGWLRAGMEGVAKINVGSKPVWWVVLHRIINYVRMTLWV